MEKVLKLLVFVLTDKLKHTKKSFDYTTQLLCIDNASKVVVYL